MRRLLLSALGLAVIVGGLYGLWVATAQDPMGRLPTWVQKRPSMYLDEALNRIEQHGFGASTVDWRAVRQHATETATGATSPADTVTAIRYALDQLPDHLSLLVTPAPLGPAGRGYGIQVLFPDRVVAIVYPQSAAAVANIHPGDIVETVEGHPPMVNRDSRTRGAFIELPPPSAVLHIKQPSGETRDVPLDINTFELLPAETHRIGTDIGYVQLPGTSGMNGFVTAVRAGIVKADAPEVCGWIIDLRRNTGGAMWPMLQAMRAIVGEGTIGASVDASGAKTPWTYPDSTDGPVTPLAHPQGPVAVLTSRLTAGAAEGVVVAFHGRAETRTFGEPTWGTPASSQAYPLVDGASLQLTDAFFADRGGVVYRSRIPADQPMPIDWSRIGTPDDPMVLAAGTWLRGQAGCSAKK